jgi:fructokinase
MGKVYGGIEAGGTKFVCAIGGGPESLRDEIRYPTTEPEETIHQAIEFFQKGMQRFGDLSAIGIASFGPLDTHLSSPTYGFITSTPKPGWSFVNFVGSIKNSFDLPIGFDTDVNVAALGEWQWGAAQGLDTFIYLTIGTGIGGGGMVNGKLLHGLIHPEMGHMRIPHDTEVDPINGVCPYHGDCLEGLATGPAMERRWGVLAETLPKDHPAWELEAKYLAYGLVNIICTLSPQRIIMGGGVMEQPHLFPLIRRKVQDFLSEYIQADQILEGIEEYIVPPVLGNRAGVLGAIALAMNVYDGKS